MAFARMGTGYEGVQPFNAMREAVLYQEIQRAIGDWRLRCKATLCEDFKDVIGTEGPMLAQEYLQHSSPRWRQLKPGAAAMGIGGFDRRRDAMGVVVGFETDHVGVDML